MYKEKITYTDYEGTERTETFCFNLTKADLLKMEITTEGGLQKKIQKIVDAKDGAEIMAVFEDLILRSYGEISDDGRYFEKSPEKTKRFSETEAYSELFVKLATDAEAASKFVNGIVPKNDNAVIPAENK